MLDLDVLDAEARHMKIESHDDLIFDIGMHIGGDTDFYLRKGFRVVGVEANPTLCAEVEGRFPAEVASGQLTILNRAVSETREPLRFYVCQTMSAWSTASPTLRDQWARQGAVFQEIEVGGVTAANIVAQYGVPHFAKIDIEGFDLICLKGFQRIGAAPEFVSVEVDFYLVNELLAVLTALGYRRFALVGQAGVPDQVPPPDALEGYAVEFAFQRGHSGLFGRELPAEWVDARAVRAQCAAVIHQYRLAGALGRLGGVPLLGTALTRLRERRLPLAQDWYDLHATR